MDGEAVHKMRLSREFLILAATRRYALGTLLDLCLLSCFMMGWFGILRSENYIKSFLSPTEIHTKVTLLDEDVAFHYDDKEVPSSSITRHRQESWDLPKLSVRLTFSGGKTGSAWQRWIFGTGIANLEPVQAMARFVVARKQ